MPTFEGSFSPSSRQIRAERTERNRAGLDWFGWRLAGRVSAPFASRLSRFKAFLPEVHRFSNEIVTSSDSDLKTIARELGVKLRRQGFKNDDLISKTFAVVREVSGRTLGMRHYDSQLIGGRVMIEGMLAEMQTGEGKTITAALPAAVAALAGVPVHVVSANDYLTARDAEEVTPIMSFLGLSVGCVTGDVPHEERRAQYDCDITYCSNKDLTFDYLRDIMKLEATRNNLELQSESLYRNEKDDIQHELLQRGLHFVILDEADSVLIDDAKTPLVISASRQSDDELLFLTQASDIADQLKEKLHYTVHQGLRSIYLTQEGKEYIRSVAKTLGRLWVGAIRREDVVRQALTAKFLFLPNEHYIVADGKVQIVDENTGRVMPDRSWERGLHQLIELKEGLELTQTRETLAKISYQRFFRRYIHLSGMTGTASEVKRELWNFYGLHVVPIPTNKSPQRILLPTQVYSNDQAHWDAVVTSVAKVHLTGRPILIGTSSVFTSEHLSALLHEAGLPHQLLNAKQDADEAEIVSNAGQEGRITVATNMAGRGTDIKLHDDVRGIGGLHVILTEHFEAKRIDRQLAGRCARQGDPGSCQAILCLSSIDDNFMDLIACSQILKILPSTFKGIIGVGILRIAQRRVEKRHAKMRLSMLKQDDQQRELLAFSGILE